MTTNYFFYNVMLNQLGSYNLCDNYGNSLYFYNELFVQVLYKNILLPNYMISNLGRLYDINLNKFVSQNKDKDGYLRVSIKYNGKHISIGAHRLELMSFMPLKIDMYEKYVVNHRDGNKTNNAYWNLEWSTPIRNTRHGWTSGLNQNYGENHGNAIYSDELINKACSLIDLKYSNSEIATLLGFTNNDKNRFRFLTTLSYIRRGESHIQISTNYNFMKGIKKINYNEEFVILLLQFLSDESRNFTYKELADYLQIPNSERIYFKQFVDTLVSHRTYKELSSNYKLFKPIKERTEYDYLLS